MKILARNRITLFYALVDSEEDVLDEYGNITGSPKLTYKAPIRTRMAFGARHGGINITAHGLENSYEQVLLTDDMSCPITDGTIIWIGKCPMDGNGNMTPHTHIVKGIIPSLNVIAYRIAEVAQP